MTTLQRESICEKYPYCHHISNIKHYSPKILKIIHTMILYWVLYLNLSNEINCGIILENYDWLGGLLLLPDFSTKASRLLKYHLILFQGSMSEVSSAYKICYWIRVEGELVNWRVGVARFRSSVCMEKCVRGKCYLWEGGLRGIRMFVLRKRAHA